jgi:conjugative transposon TraN protein
MKIVALPKLTFLVLAFLDGFSTSAQDASLVGRKTLSLQVGLNQSVSVRFPKPITSVDRGSSLLLARKAPTVENVLLLKAGAATMPPTSLMVILSDGSLYSFQVQYSSETIPIGLELLATNTQGALAAAELTSQQPLIEEQIAKAQNMPANLGLRASTQGIRARIEGLYVADARIYLRVSLTNQSVIGYDLAGIHIALGDKAQAKRTAVQQNQISPLRALPKQNTIQSGQQLTLVIALPKLTISREKYLAVQIYENAGSRNIALRVKARHLKKMKPLSGSTL